MLAVNIAQPGGPEVLTVEERSRPRCADHDVLIKVAASGVNRPDIFQRMGLYPPPKGASDIPGLEVSGYVAEVGRAVTQVREGDPVCALVTGGGYAEYCIAHEDVCLPVPRNLTMHDAAGLPETFFTVWSNVFDRASLAQGERILIHGGSSGIGVTAIQLAHVFGAEVITTVGTQRKAEVCRALGANLAINYKDNDFVAATRDFTDGAGVDVVLDMVGGDYIPRNLSILREGGRHVSIAFLQGSKAEIDFMPVMRKRLILTGTTLRARPVEFKADIAEALSLFVFPLIEDGRIRPVIDKVFPMTEAAEAHKYMESSAHIGKILLQP